MEVYVEDYGSTAMAVDSTADDAATTNSQADFADGEFQCGGFGDGELLSYCKFGDDELLADMTLPGLFGENIGETLLLSHNVQILQTGGSMLKKMQLLIKSVFRICDILIRIRILGSVNWITDRDLNPAPDPDL
jgi:hypothetical protein